MIFSFTLFFPHQESYLPIKRLTVDGTPMVVSLGTPLGLQCASCLYVQPLPTQHVKRDWKGNAKGVVLSLSEQQHADSCPYQKGTNGETLPTT